MPDPAPFITFRTEVYQLALDLSARVFAVIELAELERYFLRDQLDKKSTAIPIAIARGLATPDMTERRGLYRRARAAVTDCGAILDVLAERGTVSRTALDAARGVVGELATRLDVLTIQPPSVR